MPVLGVPRWLAAPAPAHQRTDVVRGRLRALATVCEHARCPNQGECWAEGTATFLLLGDVCTRSCRFCAVKCGRPAPPDDVEPARLCDAVRALDLGYVVLTCVDRDDLGDGGAGHLARCVRALKDDGRTVELLAPDFGGDDDALRSVVDAGVDVLAHNLETVRRLAPSVRDRRATTDRSLALLVAAKRRRPRLITKSGLMLGLGETDDEVLDAMIELRSAGVDVLTLGQYLRPSPRHTRVERFVDPELFRALADDARTLGFLAVAASPRVRSSYRAAELWRRARTAPTT
ncbi:MAG: lipoyl synthase [Deltaproteobacteria bacterium RBG_16_71_12]|nr:MAG: lipoyl synthase [Deltaproteobacteria bacterium RBG_16_71_12]